MDEIWEEVFGALLYFIYTSVCSQWDMEHLKRKLSELCIRKTNYACGMEKREMLPRG